MDSAPSRKKAEHVENFTSSTGVQTSRRGANIEVVDKDGRTPLHDAARAGSQDTVDRLVSYWTREANLRAESYLTNGKDGNDLSLPEVIRYRIWPFYSNWLHLPLEPCTRMAKFERNEHDIITSVTIYIICKHRPTPSFEQIIKEYTQKLVPDHFKRDNQVVVDIGEGMSTPSTAAVENLPLNSPPLDMKMGDSIMSLVAKKVKGNLIADVGSSEPWFRTSNGDMFLYTNEHVVRPGMNDCKKRIVTHPEKRYIGDVILTSGEDGRSKDDAAMECNNPEVDEDVRSGHSFIADWAIIKLEQAPTKPIEMPVANNDTRPCSYINNIIHVPSRGMAMSVRAASRERSSEPWTAVYTCQIQGDGPPTVFSPRIWRNNSKELACWSLSQPKRATYTDSDWYDKGIGIPGDSGAGVVDCTTGHLCGLVIGHFL